MINNDIILKVNDYRGKEIVFKKTKWVKKRLMHPELDKPAFLRRIERALLDPDEVWEDFSDKKNKRCYYKKYSQNTYAKVVIWNNNPYLVITAYEIDKIKEKNYPNLKQIK